MHKYFTGFSMLVLAGAIVFHGVTDAKADEPRTVECIAGIKSPNKIADWMSGQIAAGRKEFATMGGHAVMCAH